MTEYSVTRTNVARLMVRRHLRSWLNAGIPEEELIGLFELALSMHPDMPMKEVAALIERRLTAAFGAQYLKEQPS